VVAAVEWHRSYDQSNQAIDACNDCGSGWRAQIANSTQIHLTGHEDCLTSVGVAGCTPCPKEICQVLERFTLLGPRWTAHVVLLASWVGTRGTRTKSGKCGSQSVLT
jgi:hypothetical protein